MRYDDIMNNIRQQIIDKVQFENNFFDPPLPLRHFLLYQVGDLMFKYSGAVPPHEQYCDLELSYMYNGTAKFFTDKKSLTVHENSAYLSLRGDEHSINSESSYRFFYFAVNVKNDSPYYPILMRLKENSNDPSARIIANKSLSSHFINILYEMLYKREFYLDVIENEIANILISLYRSPDSSLENAYKQNDYTIDLKKSLVYNIANFIDKQYLNINSVEEIVMHCGYSYTYISALFTSVMNKSLKAYLQEKKLGHAQKLLNSGTMSITEIAQLLSYSTVHNFSRAFTNFFKISPTEYREKTAENKTK